MIQSNKVDVNKRSKLNLSQGELDNATAALAEEWFSFALELAMVDMPALELLDIPLAVKEAIYKTFDGQRAPSPLIFEEVFHETSAEHECVLRLFFCFFPCAPPALANCTFLSLVCLLYGFESPQGERKWKHQHQQPKLRYIHTKTVPHKMNEHSSIISHHKQSCSSPIIPALLPICSFRIAQTTLTS